MRCATPRVGGSEQQNQSVEVELEELQREEVAVVVGSGPDELLVEAAEACPAVAISLVDSETGETVYP